MLVELYFLIITSFAYIIGKRLYIKSKSMILHPVIVASLLIILFFYLIKVDLEIYIKNTKILSFFLNISVVALGFLLHKNFEYIKEKGLAIITATFAGSIVSFVSITLIMLIFNSSITTIITVLPKSLTTPIAIGLSQQMGGVVYITAIVVIISGVFGAFIGPWLLSITGIKSKLGVGLALGSASHGMGTARALELGAIQGAVGGLAIALMGIFSSLIMPIIVPLVKILINIL